MFLGLIAAATMIGVGTADTPKTDPVSVEVCDEPSPPASNVDPVTGVEPVGPTIVMVSLPGCTPCKRWWDQRESWKDVGWRVERKYEHDGSVKEFPTFRIYHKNEWHQHVGYLTPAGARGLLGIERQENKAAESLAHGRYDGTSRWTYPGDIASHLMGENHRLSRSQLIGKSKDELEAIHSAEHERRRRPANTYQRPISSGSPCPGGSCPTQNTRRVRLFRRW